MIEQCAYKKLEIKDDECLGCDGYKEACFKYTTIDHIKQWNQQRIGRDKIGRLEDLEQGGGLI